ncbi:MAG: 3-keto-5-aminohexanoate cleavage protein, partial [Pseudomonadales bacterium]|nr:3-keto-5-aminohexanoate cleavage protein [Pseudomonadales bacterium]
LDSLCPGAPRMISGLDADISPITAEAMARGFHLRAGLEDAPLGCEKSNIQLLGEAIDQIERAGATLATAADVRAHKTK